MYRRQFLSLCGGLAASACLPAWLAGAEEAAPDLEIVRIVGFDLVSKRPKVVGKNSRLDNHGDSATDRMVRLYTRSGLEGLGNCRADEKALNALLGKSPMDFLKPGKEPAVTGPLGQWTMPVWDLVGKALKKPVFSLLGQEPARRIPVYDGSIYFSDLMPEYASRWQDRFKEEIDSGLKRGYRAFKIKIGRGAKWMPLEEGYKRDKAVLTLIRKHVGPDIVLGVDANNGYDLARTKRLLTDLPDLKPGWVEEMFPENLNDNLDLKAFLKQHRMKTLIADGETQNSVEVFRPFVETRAIDVFQLDMNGLGIEGILAEAALARTEKLLVGPHNWGSLVGFYETLHVGRAIDNFYYAENDPAETDLLIADGYTIRDGFADVPDTPGFGLKLDEEKFGRTIKPLFDLKIS